jgi:hypothetical protein
VYSEKALEARRAIGCRGFMTLQQIERIYFISAVNGGASGEAQLGKRPNKHYLGTTTGNTITHVGLPKLRTQWHVDAAVKRGMWDPDARTVAKDPVDGSNEATEAGADDASVAEAAEKSEPSAVVEGDGTMVPISYWGSDMALYEELLHRLSAKVVIDLTALDGNLAMAAMKSGVPYLGVCQTHSHATALAGRLSATVFQQFLEEGGVHYKAKLAELLKKKGVSLPAVEGDEGDEDAAPVQTPKPKPKSALQRRRAASSTSAGKNARALAAVARVAASKRRRASSSSRLSVVAPASCAAAQRLCSGVASPLNLRVPQRCYATFDCPTR